LCSGSFHGSYRRVSPLSHWPIVNGRVCWLSRRVARKTALYADQSEYNGVVFT